MLYLYLIIRRIGITKDNNLQNIYCFIFINITPVCGNYYIIIKKKKKIQSLLFFNGNDGCSLFKYIGPFICLLVWLPIALGLPQFTWLPFKAGVYCTWDYVMVKYVNSCDVNVWVYPRRLLGLCKIGMQNSLWRNGIFRIKVNT